MQGYLKNYQFWCALATLVGMIVGAGTFGIPYAMAQAGFGLGLFYLVLLAGMVVLVHLCYSEIILRTSGHHRLVGYAQIYLGRRFKGLATFIVLFEYYGSLLAYTILGGEFMKVVFGRWLGGTETLWALIFFALGVGAVFCGLKLVSRGELVMTVLLFATVAFLIIKGWPLVQSINFSGFNFSKFFLPYGVILFALAGSAAIPELRQILRGQEKKLKVAILWGTLISAVIYLGFAWMVVGVTGSATSEEAIKGLVPHLGSWVVWVGALFGILAIYTSFIALGLSLKGIFHEDFKLPELTAFILVCAVPLLAYLAGLKSFILVIGFLGAVAAGLDGILTVLVFLKARKKGDRQPEYALSGAKLLSGLLILIFALGLIYQFIYLSGK